MFHRFFIPADLYSPHIPLGSPLTEGLSLLRATGLEVVEVKSEEHSFRIDGAKYRAAVYTDGDRVKSAWYDDPAGRGTARGRARKIELYLSRYGQLSNWEQRMENGWMRYWYNPVEGVSMKYGIHMDVIRFNEYHGA